MEGYLFKLRFEKHVKIKINYPPEDDILPHSITVNIVTSHTTTNHTIRILNFRKMQFNDNQIVDKKNYK